MSFQRDPFKCFVSIKNTIDKSIINQMMTQHVGYPIDNVVQIKLSKDSFTKLFKSSAMNSSSVNVEERYNSPELLTKLENFFSSQYNNYNSIASDITILISNTYADKIDINPSNLENACKPNGQIFDYFFLSECTYLYSLNSENYDDTTSNSDKMKVFQAISRELDNMITRDISSGETTSLEELYSIQNDNFWNNLVEGDSIFIDGSFNIPGDYNVPIILQFLNMNKDIGYSFTSEINGSALDGYIANGNVKVFNLKDKLIYQTTTNETGDFSVVNIDPPFKVEISGGTDIATNEPNDLILTSLKMNAQDDLTVTPITSMLVDTFEEQGLELTEENLNSVKTTVASKMGIYEQNIYEDFISTNNSDLASKALQFAHLYRVTKSLGIQNEKQIKKKLVSKILENDLETVATDPITINSLITDIYDTFDSTNTNRTEITTNAVQIIKTVNENYKNSENNLANLYKISKGYQNNNSIIKNGIIDHIQSTENISTSIQNSIDEIPVESIYKLNKNDSSKSKPVILNSAKIPFNDKLIMYLDASNYDTANPSVWKDISDYRHDASFSVDPVYNNSSLSLLSNSPVVIYSNYSVLNNLLFNKEHTLIYVMNLKELYENTNTTYNSFIGGDSNGTFSIQRISNTPNIQFKFSLGGRLTYDWDAQTYFNADIERKEKYFMICLRKFRFDNNSLYKNSLQLYDSEGSLLINEISEPYNYTHIYTMGSATLYNIKTDKLRSIIMYNSVLSDTDVQNICNYYLLSSSTSYPKLSMKKSSEIISENVTFELISTRDKFSITDPSNGNVSLVPLKKVSDDGNIMFYTGFNIVFINNIVDNTIEEIKDETKINFGNVIEISGDGNVVGIEDNYKNLYIYKKNNGNWSLIKTYLIGSNNYSYFKFNYDGSVLIKSIGNSANGANKYVQVDKYENGNFVNKFYELNQYQSGFGSNASINGPGDTVAYYSGRMTVKKEINGVWIGDQIDDSTNPLLDANSKIVINDKGNMILGSSNSASKYKVLEYNSLSNKWFQKGNDIEYYLGFWEMFKSHDMLNDSNVIVLSNLRGSNTNFKGGNISIFIYNKETNEYNLFKEIDGPEGKEWGTSFTKIMDKDNKEKIKIITTKKTGEILHLEVSNLGEIYDISTYEF